MFKRKPRATGDGESWQVGQTEYEGKPMITRVDAAAGRLAESGKYGIQIGVAVPFTDRTETGLPSQDELPALNAIEDAIGLAISERGVLVAVITTGGMREFVIYTGTSDWIAEFDEGLQNAFGGRTIQVMAQQDPDWAAYRALLGR